MKAIVSPSTLILLLTATSSSVCLGFQIVQPTTAPNRIQTSLQMGFFDLKPFHGSGSASDNDLDQQWKIQQKILSERRGHLDKAHLKAKYKGGEGKFEVHAMKAEKSHMDDMYIEGQDEIITSSATKKKAHSVASFKFPWDKK